MGFRDDARRYQTCWLKDNWEEVSWEKKPWILPTEPWKKSLWVGIREGGRPSLPEYVDKEKITLDDEVYNLTSSWILCANLYFPFRNQKVFSVLSDFLKNHVSEAIEEVEEIELEYQDFDVEELLGEVRGSRGKKQTTPDVAFIVTTGRGKGLLLVESKYAESSFYPCSGRTSAHNPDSSICLNWEPDLPTKCFQRRWQQVIKTERPQYRILNRKYWNHIGISAQGNNTLKQCPAATTGYQLFRQQALAEAIFEQGKFDFVISCVAYDERNKELLGCLSDNGIEDFRKGWGTLLNGKAGFATFSHQGWVDWVRRNNKEDWEKWLRYVKSRYDY